MNILTWLFDSPKHHPGVYRIQNRRTRKAYIGSTSRSMCQRWAEHREALNEGSHHNPRLQADWNRYGSHAFRFQVLEVVHDLSAILSRESYWQYSTSNEYTITRASVIRQVACTSSFVQAREKLELPSDASRKEVARALAAQSQYSANVIYSIVKGNRNEVLQWVREVRNV